MNAEINPIITRRAGLYENGSPLQGEAGETTWNVESIEWAFGSIRDYLATGLEGVSSVYARIGFNSGIAENNNLPEDTLHLLLFVENSQVEAVREVFMQGSVAWNQEHTDTNRFIEVHIKPAQQETTTLANATDTYHQVYDRDAVYDRNYDIESILEDTHALARDEREANKIRRGHYYKKKGKPKKRFGGVRIDRVVDFQASQDHRRMVEPEPDPDPQREAALDKARTLFGKNLTITQVGSQNWVGFQKAISVIFEDPTVENQPLQEFITQRPKNYHGLDRRSRLYKPARPAAEDMISKAMHRHQKPPLLAVKFMDRLAKRNSGDGERFSMDQKRYLVVGTSRLSPRALLPSDREILQLDDPFMERFFVDEGSLLKEMATYLTGADAADMKVLFTASPLGLDYKYPLYTMHPLTDNASFRQKAIKCADLKRMYTRYHREVSNRQKSDVRIRFAQIISDEGEVLLSLDYTPNNANNLHLQFDPLISEGDRLHGEKQGIDLTELGVRLPYGELRITWSGSRRTSSSQIQAFHERFFQSGDAEETRPGRQEHMPKRGTIFRYQHHARNHYKTQSSINSRLRQPTDGIATSDRRSLTQKLSPPLKSAIEFLL